MPVEQVCPCVRELKAVDKAHDRRLAAAVGTEQGNEFTTIDLQRHTIDNRMPRIGEHHVAQLDERHGLGARAVRARRTIHIDRQNVALPYLHPQSKPAASTARRTTLPAAPRRPHRPHRASQTRHARAPDTHRQSRGKA